MSIIVPFIQTYPVRVQSHTIQYFKRSNHPPSRSLKGKAKLSTSSNRKWRPSLWTIIDRPCRLFSSSPKSRTHKIGQNGTRVALLPHLYSNYPSFFSIDILDDRPPSWIRPFPGKRPNLRTLPLLRVLLGVLDSQSSVNILVISHFSVKILAISQLSVNFNRSHSQLSVNILVISQLTVKILENCQLSVKPHQDPPICPPNYITRPLLRLLVTR